MVISNRQTSTGSQSPLPHHTEGGFQNPYNQEERGLSDVLKWQFGMGPKEEVLLPDSAVPEYVPQISSLDTRGINTPDTSLVQITWIGHSSFLVQIDTVNILTDPVFSERCSPVSFAGPKRVAPPGIPFEELPHIDMVLISHDHYDHLDDNTIRRLGNTPRYFVPLGIRAWLAKRHINNVEEYDWWQQGAFRHLSLTSVPAQHFSGRGITSRNKTLWCGWVVQSDATRVHFVGDTGYSPDFKEIRKRVGSMDVAMIPIGAYRPRWFMNPMHADPFQAVQIHKDLGAKVSIGTHWGTFKLSDEPLGAPPLELRMAMRQAGLTDSAFTVMNFGETRLLRL